MNRGYVLEQDAYGGYARASHLADVLEHLCLRGRSPNKSNVRDWIEDAGWVIGSDEAIESYGSVAPNADPASRVFALLAERANVLQHLYPFRLRDQRLEPRDDIDAAAAPYSALLGISLAHSYSLCTEPDPKRVFEAAVAGVLRERGLLAVDTGNERRGLSSFEDLMERVGTQLGIESTPEASTYRKRAQEEGVDAAALLSWGDNRKGRWLFLGQSTCGKSETWRTKIVDVADALWMRALDEVLPPLTFLAVPFHVEPAHFGYLVAARSAKVSVLDRLRLARYKQTVSEPEKQIASTVFSAKPEW